jgi:hypothetical protein
MKVMRGRSPSPAGKTGIGKTDMKIAIGRCFWNNIVREGEARLRRKNERKEEKT